MKITTIDQVLNLAETLNKVYEAENTTIDITVKGIESDEDLKQFAKQENGSYFEPCTDLPWYWCSVQLGNINFHVRGVSKTITFN